MPASTSQVTVHCQAFPMPCAPADAAQPPPLVASYVPLCVLHPNCYTCLLPAVCTTFLLSTAALSCSCICCCQEQDGPQPWSCHWKQRAGGAGASIDRTVATKTAYLPAVHIMLCHECLCHTNISACSPWWLLPAQHACRTHIEHEPGPCSLVTPVMIICGVLALRRSACLPSPL